MLVRVLPLKGEFMSHSPYKLAPGEQQCPICNILMGSKRLAKQTDGGYCTFCEADLKKRQQRLFREGHLSLLETPKEILLPLSTPQNGTCARLDCGQVLNHAQLVKGNKFCSRRCAALARNNQPNTKTSWIDKKAS